jgi:hypothetical protein
MALKVDVMAENFTRLQDFGSKMFREECMNNVE